MWGIKGTNEVETLFRAQFRTENGRLVFRRSSKGAPVPVSEAEVESSVAIFKRRQRIVFIGSAVAMMTAIALLVVFGPEGLLDHDGAIWFLVAVWIGPFLVAFQWAWASPTREFNRRTPLGHEKTRSQMRREMLAERTWGQLLGLSASGAVIAGFNLKHWPPTGIEEWVWVALGLFLIGATAFSAVIKWRLRGS